MLDSGSYVNGTANKPIEGEQKNLELSEIMEKKQAVSRRKFLGTAGAAGVIGTIGFSSFIASCEKDKNSRNIPAINKLDQAPDGALLKAGLVGCGNRGTGAAFDFLAGTVKQAPAWMQRSGLEWLYRLIQEPRRLWRRYIWNNPSYVILLAWQVLVTKLRRHPKQP